MAAGAGLAVGENIEKSRMSKMSPDDAPEEAFVVVVVAVSSSCGGPLLLTIDEPSEMLLTSPSYDVVESEESRDALGMTTDDGALRATD